MRGFKLSPVITLFSVACLHLSIQFKHKSQTEQIRINYELKYGSADLAAETVVYVVT